MNRTSHRIVDETCPPCPECDRVMAYANGSVLGRRGPRRFVCITAADELLAKVEAGKPMSHKRFRSYTRRDLEQLQAGQRF